jgi:DNA-binding transcriptional LysR family regulator
VIRLHQLEGFYYAGKAGGYARAAEAMPFPITAPAVYQQIRKLERALGKSLVTQASRRLMVLTPEGRLLHRFIAPFFTGLPAVVQSVREGEAARLVIAAHGALARDVLAPALAALAARRPALEVRVSEGDERHVAAMLRSGEADVGLGILQETEGLDQTFLFSVRIALLVPGGHALGRRRRPPSPADLDGLPLCVYEKGKAGRALLEDAFAKAGIRLRIAAEASTVETLRALVAAGVAPAFVPVVGSRRARLEASGMKTLDVTSLVPGPPVRYGLLTRRDAPTHPAVAALRGLLRVQ